MKRVKTACNGIKNNAKPKRLYTNDFVFLDEKIGVKIKLKPNQEKAIVTESKAVYKQEKTKSIN